MICYVHPGSGFFFHPRFRIQGLKKHWIQIRNTGKQINWLSFMRWTISLEGWGIFRSLVVLRVGSVPDPCHFGRDPYPMIRTLYLRIRIQILLFSSVTSKMPTKNKFFSNFLVLISAGTFTSVFKYIKSLSIHVTTEIKDFVIFFCLLMEGSGSVQNNLDLGGPKLRIWDPG